MIKKKKTHLMLQLSPFTVSLSRIAPPCEAIAIRISMIAVEMRTRTQSNLTDVVSGHDGTEALRT